MTSIRMFRKIAAQMALLMVLCCSGRFCADAGPGQFRVKRRKVVEWAAVSAGEWAVAEILRRWKTGNWR